MKRVFVEMEDTLELEVKVPGGSLTIVVPVEQIVRQHGYNTKCNKCDRLGTPGTAGLVCGSCGHCLGLMIPEGGTFTIKP